MTVYLRPLAEITQEAIRVLSREIGVADTLRFMGQFTTGSGNYTEERDRLFEGLTLDDILAEIRTLPAPAGGDD
jgi:hypothetical protein